MEPASAVLLAVIICIVPLAVRAKNKIDDKIDGLKEQYSKIDKSNAIVETKVDILLYRAGFDLRKVNKDIADHMDEIEKNDKPKIGCIDVDSLYREDT